MWLKMVWCSKASGHLWEQGLRHWYLQCPFFRLLLMLMLLSLVLQTHTTGFVPEWRRSIVMPWSCVSFAWSLWNIGYRLDCWRILWDIVTQKVTLIYSISTSNCLDCHIKKSTESTKENICSLQCSEHAECLTPRPWMQAHTSGDEEWTPISRTPYSFINYIQFVTVSVLRCQLAYLVLFSVFMPLANRVYMSVICIGHGIHTWQPFWLNL